MQTIDYRPLYLESGLVPSFEMTGRYGMKDNTEISLINQNLENLSLASIITMHKAAE